MPELKDGQRRASADESGAWGASILIARETRSDVGVH